MQEAQIVDANPFGDAVGKKSEVLPKLALLYARRTNTGNTDGNTAKRCS